MVETAVKVTQEQLRKALVSVLRDRSQVTVGREGVQWGDLLPRCHAPISEADWEAAAAAEGLRTEGEKPWGRTIWRRGTAKQAVPAMKYTPGRGLHLASDVSQGTENERHGATERQETDPEKIAAEARRLVDAEAKAGHSLGYADAVQHVLKQGRTNGKLHNVLESVGAQPSGTISRMPGKNPLSITSPCTGRESCSRAEGSRQGNAPVPLSLMPRVAPGTQAPKVADAQSVRELVEYEREHGREISYAQASELLAGSSSADPKQIALRARHHMDAEAKQGRTCSYSQAVKAVTNQQQ